jgi:hypothetical protein
MTYQSYPSCCNEVRMITGKLETNLGGDYVLSEIYVLVYSVCGMIILKWISEK